MTEKEKMLSQQYYNSWDNELVEEREQAKSLIFELNSLNPFEREKRLQIIKKLLPNVGKKIWLESPFNCDYGGNITFGENFYANTNFTVLDGAPVKIGNNVLVGPNVSLYTVNHAFDVAARNAGLEQALPITIGDNVWLGGSVVILGGVTIGDNTIIGAGSVVTHNIEANVLAVGNPARVLRQLTDADKKRHYKSTFI
ncbi:sugar O-acetyltransferase [Weissella paramesenteroides]